MSIPKLSAITAELNRKARLHPIGHLQEIRAELHQKRRAGRDVFNNPSTFRDGAFHYGGATELQFNIWREGDKLRHGVAFSFQRTQTLQDPVRTLSPKVRLYNDFMRRHSQL